MTALEDLRPGDETDAYEVLAHPTRQADGQIRVSVRYFADPWREGFVNGDSDEDVVVIHRGPSS